LWQKICDKFALKNFAKANASKKCNISPQKQKIDCNAKQSCNKS
jgi:hypothetical protein